MIKEALAAGWRESRAWGKTYRRVQILTISDLFGSAGVDVPPQYGSHQRAGRWKPGRRECGWGESAGFDVVGLIHYRGAERHA